MGLEPISIKNMEEKTNDLYEGGSSYVKESQTSHQ